MDQPFDELYHRQKQVIAEVIEAEKALEEKTNQMPDPADYLNLDLSKLNAEQFGEVANTLEKFQSPFTVSQKRRKEALLEERLKEVQSGETRNGAYKFDYSETADLKTQVENGLLTPKQASQIKQMLQESQDVNLGYAFVTFSHADEARLFMLENHNAYYDDRQIDIFLKSKLDHSDMDMQYFMARARNEAKTVDELVAVREAR